MSITYVSVSHASMSLSMCVPACVSCARTHVSLCVRAHMHVCLCMWLCACMRVHVLHTRVPPVWL